MTKEYKININGDDITYGALVTRSHFSEEEWQAIYTELVKQDLFNMKKEDYTSVTY